MKWDLGSKEPRGRSLQPGCCTSRPGGQRVQQPAWLPSWGREEALQHDNMMRATA